MVDGGDVVCGFEGRPGRGGRRRIERSHGERVV